MFFRFSVQSLLTFSLLIVASFFTVASAESYTQWECGNMPDPPDYRFVIVSSSLGANGACLAAFGVSFSSRPRSWYHCGSPAIGACVSRGTIGVPPEPLDPNSPFCAEYPDDISCSSPDPDPDPNNPTDPSHPNYDFCEQNPSSSVCSPAYEEPEFCGDGLGSSSCCHSYAFNHCAAQSATLNTFTYTEFDNKCTWSCNYDDPDPVNPDPNDPDPNDPDPNDPDPNDPDPNDPDPNDPDPNDPPPNGSGGSGGSGNTEIIVIEGEGGNVTVEVFSEFNADMSGVESRLDALNSSVNSLDFDVSGVESRLDTLNSSINSLDLSTNVDIDLSGVEQRLDDLNTVPSDVSGALPDSDFLDLLDDDNLSGRINDALGVTGEESYSDIESTVTLTDFSEDFTYRLPDAQCPAPLTISVAGVNHQFSYDPLCDIFSFLGNLVFLSAFFFVPAIVFGGRK